MTLDLRLSFSQREAENTVTYLLSLKYLQPWSYRLSNLIYIFFYIERRRGNIRKQNSKVRRKE